jgi:hypothetical protein
MLGRSDAPPRRGAAADAADRSFGAMPGWGRTRRRSRPRARLTDDPGGASFLGRFHAGVLSWRASWKRPATRTDGLWPALAMPRPGYSELSERSKKARVSALAAALVKVSAAAGMPSVDRLTSGWVIVREPRASASRSRRWSSSAGEFYLRHDDPVSPSGARRRHRGAGGLSRSRAAP